MEKLLEQLAAGVDGSTHDRLGLVKLARHVDRVRAMAREQERYWAPGFAAARSRYARVVEGFKSVHRIRRLTRKQLSVARKVQPGPFAV